MAVSSALSSSLPSPQEGAQTPLFCLVSPSLELAKLAASRASKGDRGLQMGRGKHHHQKEGQMTSLLDSIVPGYFKSKIPSWSLSSMRAATPGLTFRMVPPSSSPGGPPAAGRLVIGHLWLCSFALLRYCLAVVEKAGEARKSL